MCRDFSWQLAYAGQVFPFQFLHYSMTVSYIAQPMPLLPKFRVKVGGMGKWKVAREMSRR